MKTQKTRSIKIHPQKLIIICPKILQAISKIGLRAPLLYLFCRHGTYRATTNLCPLIFDPFISIFDRFVQKNYVWTFFYISTEMNKINCEQAIHVENNCFISHLHILYDEIQKIESLKDFLTNLHHILYEMRFYEFTLKTSFIHFSQAPMQNE